MEDPSAMMDQLRNLVAQAHSAIEAAGLGVERLVITALIVVVGLLLVRLARRRMRARLRQLHKDRGLPFETIVAIERWAVLLLWIVVAIVLLNYWNVQFGSLWATLISVLGVVGVGLLATWTMASNMTAGTLLAITKPFELGQEIEILPEGVKGRAIDRNMMFTTLREADGSTVTIPNNLIFQRIVRCEGSRRRRGIDDYEDPELPRPLEESDQPASGRT